MSIPDWATTVSGVLAVSAAIGLGLRHAMKVMVHDYLSELKPNGGSSLKDTVNRLENRVDEIYRILAERQ